MLPVRSLVLTLSVALAAVHAPPAAAQDAGDEGAEVAPPEEGEGGDAPRVDAEEDGASDIDAGDLASWEAPEPPVYETWWFWTAIGAVVLGVTLAIVVGVTTDHPRSDPPPPMGLSVAF